MVDNRVARKRLLHVLDTYGIKLTFIAKELGWDYTNLNKFKNGKLDMSLDRLRVLNAFLNRYDSIAI
jgi:hypothetical protein